MTKIADNSIELEMGENIQDRIFTIRGAQVMLDADLAALYNVETRVLNQAVKRNIQRFPEEFCFQLRDKELDTLTSQIVISNDGRTLKSQFATSSRGGRRSMPYAFTEQGVAMLSAVLRSDTAIKTSIQIMNAFVAMRHFIASNAQLFQRLDTLELKQLDTDIKMERMLNALASREVRPRQGIFYDGQVFDARIFASPRSIANNTPGSNQYGLNVRRKYKCTDKMIMLNIIERIDNVMPKWDEKCFGAFLP